MTKITSLDKSASEWTNLAVVYGTAGLLCYFGSVVFKPLPWSVARLLFFAIGPLTVISSVAVFKALSSSSKQAHLILGVILTASSGIILNLMAVIQDVQFTYFGEQIELATSDLARDRIEEMMWGVNVVQSGLDISWDIFISLGTVFVSLAAWSNPLIGKTIGGLGLMAAIAAFAFNMISYPTAPSEAGLFDLGPAVGVWHGILLTKMYVNKHYFP